MERKNIPFIPLDALTHALDHTYPQFQIRSGGWETIPDKFYPFLRELVKTMGWTLPSCVIEGDSFLPEHAEKLLKEFNVRCIFLGASHITLEDIKGKSVHDDWVSDLSKEEQDKIPEWLISTSEMFRREAEKHNIPYFDMSENREKKLEEAYSALFE